MPPQMIQGIVERLAEIEERQAELTAEYNLLWGHVYELADEIAGPNEAWRWTHPDLKKTIGRVMAENSPRLDTERLKGLLSDDEWRMCTKQERLFNLERLEHAVAAGDINQGMVEEATEQKPATARKHWRQASKDELAKLAEQALS